MKTGLKSLLFGCHQFILHPAFVYIAWIKLYKKYPTFYETIAIIIHDWGLYKCKNIDDADGEKHPIFASKIMTVITGDHKFGDFVMYHSRYLARKHNKRISKLCLADKYGTALMPTWLWVSLAKLSGELYEYMSETKYEIFEPKYMQEYRKTSPYKFFKSYKNICDDWISGKKSLEPWINE